MIAGTLLHLYQTLAGHDGCIRGSRRRFQSLLEVKAAGRKEGVM